MKRQFRRNPYSLDSQFEHILIQTQLLRFNELKNMMEPGSFHFQMEVHFSSTRIIKIEMCLLIPGGLPEKVKVPPFQYYN